MATYLDLVAQQQLNKRGLALESLLAMSDELINLFEWRAPSTDLYDEVSVDSWIIDGISPRQINQGYTTLHLGTGSMLRFPITPYGGVDPIDPKLQQMQPDRFNLIAKRAARAIPIEWANSILDPLKLGTATDTIESLPAYCAKMQRTISAGTNGGALNLMHLDQLVMMCRRVANKAFFLVPDKLFARLSQLTRNQAIAGNMSLGIGELGSPVLSYNGIPIYGAGKTVYNKDRLDFNETMGTATDTGSIYLIYTGDEGVYGTRQALRETLTAQQYVLLADGTYAPQIIHGIEQPLGISYASPYAVARLAGIKNIKIVDEV